MKSLWAPWRMTYINGEAEQPGTGCIFCVTDNNARPDKDRLILKVDRLTMIMMNRFPYTNGHLLAAPRRHVSALSDLDHNEMADLLDKTRTCVEVLKAHSNPDGFNLGLNLGRVAGAGVDDHIHFHIVPRWSGDTNFMTVMADVRVIPEHLEATFDHLVKVFNDY